MDAIFEKGDIVRFKDETRVCPDYLHNVENIYQIIKVDGEIVVVSRNFSKEIEVGLHEITGVKMNGVEDRYIYFNPVIAATVVNAGDPIPSFKKDYSYFLDANILFPHNKRMRDFIRENNFLYVHELQHYLRKYFQTDVLKIRV